MTPHSSSTPRRLRNGVSGELPDRILHVLWRMSIGGAERAVYQLVREQRRRGVAADVLVGSAAGFYGERVRETGATVHELRMRHAFDLIRGRRAPSIYRDYPTIHMHAPEPLLIVLAARCPHARLFYTHRGGERRYSAWKRVRHAIAGHYLRKRFHGISGNTTQSANVAMALFRLPPGAVQVTYNGLDFELLEPLRARDEVVHELGDAAHLRVGTSANLQRWKRIDLLLRAVAQLNGMAIQCVVLGDGPARGELEALAARLGIGDRVRFTGRKEHIGDYLQALDVFVLPSGPEEAFGNSVVEAMGVGLPPIVFADGGGLREHIVDGRTGFVVEDTDALVTRLRELAEDKDLRARMGRAARTAVRDKYSLDAMVDGYSALYGSAPSE